MKKQINEFKRMQQLAGLVNENKFYSRDYVKQKYGDKSKEIEINIEDEEDNNPNIWDLYTSLETAKETDDFIKGFINTESQINENQDEVPLIPKVKSFIDKTITNSKKDKSFKDLMKADWFDNELIDELISLFPDKDYDRASKEVKNYIKGKITLKEYLKENAEELQIVDSKSENNNAQKIIRVKGRGLAGGELILSKEEFEALKELAKEFAGNRKEMSKSVNTKDKMSTQSTISIKPSGEYNLEIYRSESLGGAPRYRGYDETDGGGRLEAQQSIVYQLTESKNKHSLKENDLANDDLIYDRMLNMDQEQLISKHFKLC
jgi:hypothetical protein